MKNKAKIALHSAILALNAITADDLKKLSPVECALMLNALPFIPRLAHVRQRLARHLQPGLSVSFILHSNAHEVFLVLTTLWQYRPAYVTGEHLAVTLRRLIAAEHVVGGPYYFKNTDTILVNAQIAIFMRLVAKPLPNVDAFLARVVGQNQLDNLPMGQIWLLAQANIMPQLVPYIRSRWMRESWQTPLGLATALVALEGNLSTHQVKHALTALCNQQRSGFWEDRSVVLAEQKAKLITTAIVAGVLARYQPPAKNNSESSLRTRQQMITKAACQTFASATEPLRSTALDLVAQVGAADKNFEITQLSLLFAKALKSPDSLTDKQHKELGLASLFGWMAYTVYDDFLDYQGQPAKLPVANIAMRASVECFREALPTHAFVRYVAKVFSDMDQANAWEVDYCRFVVEDDEVIIGGLPQYRRRTVLASRSFAHTLAPMAVLRHGMRGNTSHMRRIKMAFTHYLIARQLCDDLHDWADDIKTGQASYVVTAILRDMHVKPGTYMLADLLPAMHKSFRRVVLPKVCRCILRHVAVSRREFQKSELLRRHNGLYALLDNLESTAKYSLDMQVKSFEFYKTYKTIKLNKR